MPVFSGKRLSERTLFWRYGGGKAVRQGSWKLVIKDGKPELFNLADDLGEKNDIAERQPEIVKRLSQALAGWEDSVGMNIRPAEKVKQNAQGQR